MTPQNFCYWLQGYFELSSSNSLDSNQVKTIRNHIALVKKCLEQPQPNAIPSHGFPWGPPAHSSGGVQYRC